LSEGRVLAGRLPFPFGEPSFSQKSKNRKKQKPKEQGARVSVGGTPTLPFKRAVSFREKAKKQKKRKPLERGERWRDAYPTPRRAVFSPKLLETSLLKKGEKLLSREVC